MKKSLTAFASSYFSQNNITLDCAISALLVVGCAMIGFLSRAMLLDLQTNLFILT